MMSIGETIMSQKREGNAVYLQSGGPTAVINTSLLGAYETFKKNSAGKFYLSENGILGLLGEKNFNELDGDLSFLRYRPGAYAGTVRKKIPEDVKDPIAKQIIDRLREYNITSVFVNGGNDSMDTAHKLSEYVKYYDYDCSVMGVPKTVDNDLLETDHTPGYGTAAKLVANTTIAITIDELSYNKGKIQIIECMGRDAGYITAASILASDRGYKPDFILTPEMVFDLDKFVKKATEVYDKKKHCIVVASEGIKDKNGKLVVDTGEVDSFGNKVLGGVGQFLASKIEQKGYPARACILANLGRASSFMLSKTDSDEAFMAGSIAVLNALEGKSGSMVGFKRISFDPYEIEYVLIPLQKVGGIAKPMSKKYISKSGDNIDDSYLEYVRPLIKGNVKSLAEDGLLIGK